MNLDKNQLFPNQRDLSERDSFECVGLTIADVLGNYYIIPMDPDYPYSLGFYLNSQTPADTGVDPYSALQAVVAYGILSVSMETWNAMIMGELYAANYANFNLEQRKLALTYAQNGIVTLKGYNSVPGYLMQYKRGAIMAMKWYESFNTPNQDGTLPAPNGASSYHCVAVYEDTTKGLRIKPWLGKGYGDNGYAYMSEITYNLVVQGCWGFNPDLWRWGQVAWIAATHPLLISDLWPQLSNH